MVVPICGSLEDNDMAEAYLKIALSRKENFSNLRRHTCPYPFTRYET
jgi:hypothetical protein